jgi:flagellar hook assembly protein FlgD
MPASERTTVSYTLGGATRGQTAPTRLSVYDVTGRRVRDLETGSAGEGPHSVEWDLRNDDGDRVASGCYLIVLEHGGERAAGKALVLR